MLALYLAALGFGGTLIAVSLLLGGGMDKSFDKDLGDHDGDWWGPLLSLRFWTFGLAAFGLAGGLASLLLDGSAVPFLLALLLGGGSGVAASRFFAALNRDQVTGDVDLARYAGEEAVVVLSVRAGQLGKIAVGTLAGRVEMAARTRDPEGIPVGAKVIVASVGADGVADISRLAPLDERARARAAQQAAADERERPG